jgi:hypothetical protein
MTSFPKLRRDAAKRWAEWAHAIADGGELPPPMQVLEAGALLGVESPMAALEADAEVLLEVADLERRAAHARDTIAAQSAAHGGPEGIRDRIRTLKVELRKLEGLTGVTAAHHSFGQLAGEASRLRAKHPRVFATTATKPATKRAKEAAA